MKRNNVKIRIEPAILKYARYCSGYEISEIAQKAKIREKELEFLEHQGAEISLSTIEKLAEIYKMPLAYFFLKEVPHDVFLPKDFRIIYASKKTKYSPQLMLSIRRVRYIQSVIQELIENEIKYPFKKININDDVEETARYFRSLMNISVKEQSSWVTPSIALRNWKSVIEKLDIFILQQSLSKDAVSAFCLADITPYVLVLNSKEHENRRIFSLFHEIGHILLHHSGICTPDNFSRNSFEYIKIEKYCNQFAASLLVPHNDFIDDAIVKKLRKIKFNQWNEEDIKTLCDHFRVSHEVIYRRLVTVGILSEDEYQWKRDELIRKFEEYKKSKKKKELKIPQYIKVISKNGRSYSSLILDRLHSNKITLVDAADYLDTNYKHVTTVEANL